MAKRIKLCDRTLPSYTLSQELVNAISHGAGALFGIAALILCVKKSLGIGVIETVASAVYGFCLIALYTLSCVYHSLGRNTGKKVLQIIDHCAIYFLIAGSYTIICLGSIRRAVPVLGWSIFALEWILCAIATSLTAIDLKKYQAFSMVCYIGMGWAVIPTAGKVLAIIGAAGFGYLLAGGITYTIGAVLYGLGSKKPWMHSVFHLFVLAGSVLQFICFYYFGM